MWIPILVALWKANYSVYGARKMWVAARKAGHEIGRDQIARLMKQAGISGVSKLKRVRTTRRDDTADRPPDLVDRDFTAERPNALWVTDLTYVPTWSGMVYVCFIIDAFSRKIVGWRAADHMRTDMVLDALEMARFNRGTILEGLIAHSDAGSQYTLHQPGRTSSLSLPLDHTRVTRHGKPLDYLKGAMSAISFTESRPTEILANLHESAGAEREYLFASHDADNHDLILVAWHQTKAIGYLAATDQRPDELLVWEHLVVPQYRNQGIGKQLLLEAAKRIPPHAHIIIDPMGELDTERVMDYYAGLGFTANDKTKRVQATASEIVVLLGEQREDATTIDTILATKTPGVVTISPSAPIQEALGLMNELRIGAIVASTDGSRIEGILSERDLLVGIDTHGSAYLDRTVAECTTSNVVTATTDDLISHVMDTMTSRRIRHLPITNTGRLVGIISVGDLLLFRLNQLTDPATTPTEQDPS